MKIVFKAQHIYALALAYMLSFLAFLNLGNELLNMLGMHTKLDTVLLYGILVGFVALGLSFAFVKDYRHLRLDTIGIILFLALSYLMTVLAFPGKAGYIFTSWSDFFENPIYVLFIYTLPGYVFARQLEDYESFNKYMRIFSYIVVSISVIIFFFAKTSTALQYMTFSYNMLTQLFFLIIHKPTKYKNLHYGIVAIGIFVFVFGGARGAMLSLIIAGVLLYLLSNKTKVKNVIICILAAVVGIVFSFLKNGLFIFISGVLENLSIDSRTFKFLSSGELFNDSHRFKLYEESIENIGFIGKGIMGDRIILDSYPHNLFLELMLQYGWLIGIVISVLICFCVVRALMKKNSPEFLFIIMLLPCGFLKLMVTGSYINQEPAFYILLGFCLNAILRSKSNANTIDKHGIRSQ